MRAEISCGGVLLVVDLGVPVGAHVTLDRGDGAVDVGDGLALGDLADEHLAGLGERDDGWGGASAFGVRDDGGLATLKHGDHEFVVPRSMPTARDMWRSSLVPAPVGR